MDDDRITETEAAALLEISSAALRQRRERAARGVNRTACPPWHRTRSNRIRYLRAEVLAWLAKRDELVADPRSTTLADLEAGA